MDKERVLQRIQAGGLVAVVRSDSAEQARRIADACLAGGVAAVEITFTVPKAHRLIEELAGCYPHGEILLGAGTVLDAETARIAILSGAQYVVSPYLDEDTLRLCNRYRVACMPGVMTVREAVRAMEAGADLLKVFPANLFGPAILSSLLGPLPQAKLMPTGGVEVDNAAQWISAGAVALGAGSSLTAGAKTGDYAAITRKAQAFIAAIARARGM
ncbi:MAG: bifunctional 2-keto-4-hydroxyglutarate aldolase/2-keto-3-deoxy-6-phosphogluconate aldolase [Eubacteriales bacterium]|nr:bifunctional 2-keto-4-hydroxyglutarate aldolase/2-keto-3-deoxy-6-phosphogluconate aldolase [Eubacteriales bacterium]